MENKITGFEKHMDYFDNWREWFRSPASPALIRAAEAKLGYPFSPQHKVFLATYGGGKIIDIAIFGVNDLVWWNLDLMPSEWWPQSWFVLGRDGYGNYLVSDVQHPGLFGEYEVWFVDHEEVIGDDTPYTRLSRDFFGMLGWAVEDMKGMYSPQGKSLGHSDR